jgi:hypothetical protein
MQHWVYIASEFTPEDKTPLTGPLRQFISSDICPDDIKPKLAWILDKWEFELSAEGAARNLDEARNCARRDRKAGIILTKD